MSFEDRFTELYTMCMEWSFTDKSWIKFWPKGTKNKDYPVKTYYKYSDIRERFPVYITSNNVLYKVYDKTCKKQTTLGEAIINNIKPYKTVTIKENYE